MKKLKKQEKQSNKKSLKILVSVWVLTMTFLTCSLAGCLEGAKYRRIAKLINDNAIYAEQEITKEMVKEYSIKELLPNDEYARIYTKEEFAILQNQKAGNYAGFGVSFYNEELVIKSIIINSPAEFSGIMPNDQITALTIKGVKTELNNFNEFSVALSSVEIDEEVIFTVKRNNAELNFSIKKSEYKAGYVSYIDNQKELKIRTDENGEFYLQEITENKNELLNNSTAYIGLKEFNGKASEQLELVLKEVKDKNKTNVILDLRDNGGGSVSILTNICEQLLPSSAKDGSVVMYNNYKSSKGCVKTDKDGTNDYIERLVVLANENTASASEALIGVLNCYRVGGFSLDNLIVEYNSNRNDYSTYGKGIMQTTYKLFLGGGVKITTANNYWPDNATCIHGKGIKPANVSNCVPKGMALGRAIETFN